MLYNHLDKVLGVMMALLALIVFVRQRRKYARYRRTTGQVIAIEKDFDGDHQTLKPIIRFKPDGCVEDTTFESSTNANFAALYVGERVRILYDPERPARAIIAGWRQYFWPALTLCVAIGLLFS